MRALRITNQAVFPKKTLFRRQKQPVGFALKLLNRDFSPRMRLHKRVELVVFLHAGFPRRRRRNCRAKLLKVRTDSIESQTASAVGTLDSSHST
jgi:hypothetical protein